MQLQQLTSLYTNPSSYVSYLISSGIGPYFLGVNDLVSYKIYNGSDYCKQKVHNKFINNYVNGMNTLNFIYHVAYIGQVADNCFPNLSVSAISFSQGNKFQTFLCTLVAYYLNNPTAQPKNDVFVFMSEVMFKIPHIIFNSFKLLELFLAKYDQKYNVKLNINIEENKLRMLSITSSTFTLYVLPFSRLPNESDDDSELTYCEFVKYSEKIIMTTGDASYQEAISMKKQVFHDMIFNKVPMVLHFLNSYYAYIYTKYQHDNDKSLKYFKLFKST